MTNLSPTDWRALCAELLKAVVCMPWEYDWRGEPVGPLAEIEEAPFDRARAALARWGRPAIQPEPDDEVAATRKIWESLAAQLVHESWRHEHDSPAHDLMQRAAAALNNWGMSWPTPTIQPVPVTEHLPGPEDCDAEGRCWWGVPAGTVDPNDERVSAAGWALVGVMPDATHWLPHWALPVPEVR
jgi:hypothetical protein